MQFQLLFLGSSAEFCPLVGSLSAGDSRVWNNSAANSRVLHWDLTKLLPILDAAELLGLVTVEKGEAKLSREGYRMIDRSFAMGLIFFGRPDGALLVSLGALVPDLDREYWFVREENYRDEQPHRARFHNVFVMALGFLLIDRSRTLEETVDRSIDQTRKLEESSRLF